MEGVAQAERKERAYRSVGTIGTNISYTTRNEEGETRLYRAWLGKRIRKTATRVS